MIHKYKMNGINIVLDVNSGAVHVVDDIVYDIVDEYLSLSKEEILEKYSEKYEKEALLSALSEIETLKNEDMLFTKDNYEKAAPYIKKRQPVVKALCLHVAHDCNLKCKYCFAEEGEYHGCRSLMSAEVGKAALDFLLKNSGTRKNLEVDFFGGEPLMNFDVVKEIVNYGREREKEYGKNFRFTITTNGVLLDDDKRKFIDENMSNLVMSIDGRKEIHDLMRPFANGKGSYDAVVPKFQKAALDRENKDYYARGTFTRNNLDFSKDVLHMADLGFKHVSVEPVVGDPKEDYVIRESDLDKIYEEYETLAKEICKRKAEGNDNFHFFHFDIDLTGGPCVIKRLIGCGAGTEYLSVTPTGDLYPCHQFAGEEDFKMGNVFDGVTNTKPREIFENCNVYTKDECKKCWCKFYCSGGCAANAYHENHDVNIPYEMGCKLQRKRIECAIMIKAFEFNNL